VQPGDKVTGLVNESVWIPPGDWIEAETGKHFHGPMTVKRSFSIRQVPVYVRDGAIIPMAPPMRYSNEKPLDPLIVKVFPLDEGQHSQYTLYQDAGDTRAYQQGQAAWTTISASENSSGLTLNIAPVKGGYPGMLAQRSYQILLPGDWPPQSVEVNGKSLNYSSKSGTGWSFEGNTLTTKISTPAFSVNQSVTIVVRHAAGLEKRRAELDDFAGTMTRLREAYDTLNQTWPLGWSPDQLIDAKQTGDRLSYHPELASDQVTRLHAMLPKVATSIDELGSKMNDQQREALAQRLTTEYKSEGAKQIAAHYKDRLARAKAAVEDVSPPQK
jgi:alpha-glucosidase